MGKDLDLILRWWPHSVILLNQNCRIAIGRFNWTCDFKHIDQLAAKLFFKPMRQTGSLHNFERVSLLTELA